MDGGYPEKVWTERPRTFEHLRVFRCRVFTHVPADERTKLNSRSWECILLGYQTDKFGYKLYDSATMKSVHSWNVVFIEDQTIKDIKAQNPTGIG